jgi:ribosome-binding factor A
MKPYRKEKIGSLVRDIVAEAVHHRIHDPRVVPLTTVTRVEVSPDLQIANVYLSVHGGDAAERKTLAAIRHAGGYIQRMVARELSLRQCPELRFEIDERAKRVQQTMQLLEENRRRHPQLFEAGDVDGDGGLDQADRDRDESAAAPPESHEEGPDR